MAKTASTTFREIIISIKRKEFAPVYILMGEEPYYIDKIVEALEENVVDEADKDFNSFIYYGADVSLDVVIGSAQQLPMMSDYQLVMLKEAQSMPRAKTALEKLAPYMSKPNKNTVLVVAFKGESLNATSKMLKQAVAAGAVVFKSEKVRDYQVATPIKDYCASKKVSIDDAAVTMLADYVGTSLESLFGAIDKIVISQGDKPHRINIDDVATNIGISREFNSFELIKAIGSRKYARAQMIVNYFKNNPKNNSTAMVNATLFNFFAKLVVAHLSADKSDAGLMAATGSRNVYALREIKESMRNYNLSQSMKAISAIRDFDARSKGIGSFQNEYELLRELIFKFFT